MIARTKRNMNFIAIHQKNKIKLMDKRYIKHSTRLSIILLYRTLFTIFYLSSFCCWSYRKNVHLPLVFFLLELIYFLGDYYAYNFGCFYILLCIIKSIIELCSYYCCVVFFFLQWLLVLHFFLHKVFRGFFLLLLI